jgi:hypothetical protein
MLGFTAPFDQGPCVWERAPQVWKRYP